VIQAIQRRLAARQGDNREGGFTLIELMVVVMIIAILIGIAIPAFLGARKRAQDTASKSNLRNALATAQTIYTDAQAYEAVGAIGTAKTMLDDLSKEEPSLTFVANGVASATAKQISVLTKDSGSAGSLDEVLLASKSGSGKCFFLRHVNSSNVPGMSGDYIAEGTTCTADAGDALPTSGATNAWSAL
jgi:prepilin-type N-terminal cleavage/methylation domain-containing protein